MMLRSSSTPLLGSLLPSFSDNSSTELLHTSSPIHGQIWCSMSAGSHNFRRPFRSPSLPETTGTCTGGFRRVQSEGNLDELLDSSSSSSSSYGNGGDELTISKKQPGRHSGRTLEAIPSFSEIVPCEEHEIRDSLQSGTEVKIKYDNSREEVEGKMYLAIGLGAESSVGNGGGGNSRPFGQVNGDGRSHGLEDHYKRMLEEDPRNPLALRNYANFLYQVKGDLRAAEEYSRRAVVANPEDGDILSQYAKLTWELHRDLEKANHYFEKAVRASPVDSHVHAAYASFLWNMSEDEEELEEEKPVESPRLAPQSLHFQCGLQAAGT